VNIKRPKGILLDYGGTLVEELVFDVRAGNEWLLDRASWRPPDVKLQQVLDQAARVTSEVAGRRDEFQIETPWPALTRLIHDQLGIRFEDPMPELELGFWKASTRTRAMPGAREALEQFYRSEVPSAVVSNTGFSEHVIRYELAKHGLADRLAFIMVSAEYCVRKPNVLLFDTAAARLGVQPNDIWFVGDRLDTDMLGAKAAGMTAVWLRARGADDVSTHPADFVIADLNELVCRFQES
jgi:putative hydrolase of the HAD superfamily